MNDLVLVGWRCGHRGGGGPHAPMLTPRLCRTWHLVLLASVMPCSVRPQAPAEPLLGVTLTDAEVHNPAGCAQRVS